MQPSLPVAFCLALRYCRVGRSIAATILARLEESTRPEPETMTVVEFVIRDTSGLRDVS
jgi:hypothetical protein